MHVCYCRQLSLFSRWPVPMKENIHPYLRVQLTLAPLFSRSVVEKETLDSFMHECHPTDTYVYIGTAHTLRSS